MDLKRYLGARRTRRQILDGAAAASLAGAYRPQGVVRAKLDEGGHVQAVVSAYEEATSAGTPKPGSFDSTRFKFSTPVCYTRSYPRLSVCRGVDMTTTMTIIPILFLP